MCYKIILVSKDGENNKKIIKVQNELHFEELYFSFLRRGKDFVYGYIDERLDFFITEGVEVCDHRAKILSMDPNNWIAPSSTQFKAIMLQFREKRDFISSIGVTRAAVGNWEKNRKIDFYRWSFILSYLEIKRTFREGREERLNVNFDI